MAVRSTAPASPVPRSSGTWAARVTDGTKTPLAALDGPSAAPTTAISTISAQSGREPVRYRSGAIVIAVIETRSPATLIRRGPIRSMQRPGQGLGHDVRSELGEHDQTGLRRAAGRRQHEPRERDGQQSVGGEGGGARGQDPDQPAATAERARHGSLASSRSANSWNWTVTRAASSDAAGIVCWLSVRRRLSTACTSAVSSFASAGVRVNA